MIYELVNATKMIGDNIITSKPGDGDIIEIDSQKYKGYCGVSTRIHHTAVQCYHLIRYVFLKSNVKIRIKTNLDQLGDIIYDHRQFARVVLYISREHKLPPVNDQFWALEADWKGVSSEPISDEHLLMVDEISLIDSIRIIRNIQEQNEVPSYYDLLSLLPLVPLFSYLNSQVQMKIITFMALRKYEDSKERR